MLRVFVKIPTWSGDCPFALPKEGFSALARICLGLGWKLFKVKPKLHLLGHILRLVCLSSWGLIFWLWPLVSKKKTEEPFISGTSTLIPPGSLWKPSCKLLIAESYRPYVHWSHIGNLLSLQVWIWNLFPKHIDFRSRIILFHFHFHQAGPAGVMRITWEE